MRTSCWHCGETVEYRFFARSKDVVCPDCGEPIFRPLGQAKSVFDALVLALATGAVWLLGDRLWDVEFWCALLLVAAVPLGQYLLWPLMRQGAYALRTWHYDATGILWGRHELPCWHCGGPVCVYAERDGEEVCPRCGEALFAPVKRADRALGAVELLLWIAALVWAYSLLKELTNLQMLLSLLLLSLLVSLLDIPRDPLLRRMYLRWLDRYRAGEDQAPGTGSKT